MILSTIIVTTTTASVIANDTTASYNQASGSRRRRPCAQRFRLQPLPATARWNPRVIQHLADHRSLNVTTEEKEEGMNHTWLGNAGVQKHSEEGTPRCITARSLAAPRPPRI